MNTVSLSKYDSSWYNPGSIFLRTAWYITNRIFFNTYFFWPNNLKLILLSLFKAKLGRNIIIKPKVNIKYPWFLKLGDNIWIGENVWIDNLVNVDIKNNVCISQGAFLLTGNHNYKKETFDLIIKPVKIEDGSWIGAKAVVCPGVTMRTHSVLTAGSILTKDSEPYTIYQGNPALAVKKREINN